MDKIVISEEGKICIIKKTLTLQKENTACFEITIGDFWKDHHRRPRKTAKFSLKG